MIRDLEGGMQEIYNPHEVDFQKSIRRKQQHRHLTNSDTNHNPIGNPIRVLDRSAPGYGNSGRDTSVSPSDNPTKDTSPVPIINPASVPS